MIRPIRSLVSAGLMSALLLPALHAQEPIEPVPFPIDWSRAGESAVDWSGVLDAPAGEGGFIRVENAHPVRPDGSRVRFWGVNLTGPRCFPSRDDAVLIADDLARLGVNAVRFHHMDSAWSVLFPKDRDDTRALDPEALDRLDHFIAQLKTRGIYTNINLNVGREYKAGDNVRDHDLLGYGKSATYFNPRLIELQKEFAAQLLTHENPYTGHPYAREPAVATVELVNENSLLEGWVAGRLVGSDDDPDRNATWRPIPVSYAEELTDQLNAWLPAHVSAEALAAIRVEAGVGPDGRVPRLRPDQFATASRERFHAEARFYMHLETAFFENMKRYLREDLGVAMPIVGTADHNDGISGYPHVLANTTLDFIDGHGYWEHPRLDGGLWIKNSPMVNDPLDSTVVQFARTPVVGLPYTVSETNHPFPHVYAAEGLVIETAYALLHDWDGLYWFTWGEGRTAGPGRPIRQSFDFSNDPVKVATLAACAGMWHRRDVRPAERSIVRTYTGEHLLESLRMPREERPFFDPGFARSIPLEHATRWALGAANTPAASYPPPAPLGRILSDTGELAWLDADRKAGLVTINTARTSALVGVLGGTDHTTAHLAADVANPFGTLLLTSLDDAPIARSGRLLLLATAKATNTGLRFEPDGRTLADWGRGPVVIEPLTGTITLRGLDPARAVRVVPLAAEGRPLAATLPAEPTPRGWSLRLGTPPTTWCLIEVER